MERGPWADAASEKLPDRRSRCSLLMHVAMASRQRVEMGRVEGQTRLGQRKSSLTDLAVRLGEALGWRAL